MVNEIYRLMKSGIAHRVLFLVDRRALAAQTVRAFASFEAEPGLKFDKLYPVYSQRFQQTDFDEGEKFDPTVRPNSLLTNPKLGDAFVYVSTIERMSINLFGCEAGIRFGEVDSGDEDAKKLGIPIHVFDLIVADECHRGYTAKELSAWRDTLDWFDAIKVGLTRLRWCASLHHVHAAGEAPDGLGTRLTDAIHLDCRRYGGGSQQQRNRRLHNGFHRVAARLVHVNHRQQYGGDHQRRREVDHSVAELHVGLQRRRRVDSIR
ncbi:hypothetical protein MBOT_18450 [Mycobacterium botniense]|uniref:Helicase/UvrB N-terminal domain-containing protein n=1 Tax=Mycobacterium botniense TaxID=84962 RepID=A0A7I9XXH4_9MYCO|nr:hypothetical protein MBOT_18450 [Mycobacterium botniense]